MLTPAFQGLSAGCPLSTAASLVPRANLKVVLAFWNYQTVNKQTYAGSKKSYEKFWSCGEEGRWIVCEVTEGEGLSKGRHLDGD